MNSSVSGSEEFYSVVVIGSGFGGTMTALTLANALPSTEKIHILERGTWWTTPVSTVQDKAVKTFGFLKERKQPVQYWSSAEHLKGFIDILLRCVRRPGNQDGLYDLMQCGKRGFLGIGRESDGVTILRASGVGGGSLVYSNITIQPPDFVLEDPRWPLKWTPADREKYYNLARHAIGYGVVSAWRELSFNNIPYHDPGNPPATPSGNQPKGAVNAGLSNIATRSARLDPQWTNVPGHDVKRLQTWFQLTAVSIGKLQDPDGVPASITAKLAPLDGKRFETRKLFGAELQKLLTKEELQTAQARIMGRAELPVNWRYWIDRARFFQEAMSQVTNDYGTVDSSINDITPEGSPLDPTLPHNYPGGGINYCERQGRCNIGCLPGARHTLNKQLMRAIHGAIDGKSPQFSNLTLQALAEVLLIRPIEGGYEIKYRQHQEQDSGPPIDKSIKAKRVIISSGCLGTNELLLRCREQTMPNLSDRVGRGFSTNGDYIAFYDDLQEEDGSKRLVSLTRGPVTTSFGHFQTPAAPLTAGQQPDVGKFHIVEDQGIPRSLASTLGFGRKLLRHFAKGRHRHQRWMTILTIVNWAIHRLTHMVGAFFRDAAERQDEFKSEDEYVHDMMCVVASGREASIGEFKLGRSSNESSLRLSRPDGNFWDDPIYKQIEATLKGLAPHFGASKPPYNPFLEDLPIAAKSITTTHPLGGCSMGKTVQDGVVDEFGHVFDKSKQGERPFYEGLYVADAAVIPTALGVNPSLTISALSLRIAAKIVEEMTGKKLTGS
jgi:choline dehydrogenase-like flavoprotein